MFNFFKGSQAKDAKVKDGKAKDTSAKQRSSSRSPDPHFEIVSLDQWTIAFRSRTVYPICQTMVLFVSGGPNSALTNCRIEVFLTSSRMISPEMIEYTGELQHAPPEFAELFVVREVAEDGPTSPPSGGPPATVPAVPPALPGVPAGVTGGVGTTSVAASVSGLAVTEQRVAQRANRAFRVVSRDLQRFKAMCGDISSTGIKLIADEEIPRGKQLELDLDFDDFRFPKVRFRAEVVWCKKRDDSTFWVGMRFMDMQDQEKRLLETYVEFVSRMQAPMEAESP